ncbi:MAG: YkgJ family cysteine cluster protein [Chloroflexota bacterium]|jgi:uncharacterized protein
MLCRTNCGICCIAPSISSPIPGMPQGKPAGQVCIHLDLTTRRCAIWGAPHYPAVCRNFTPTPDVCGQSREEAMILLTTLEVETRPIP